MHSDEQLITLLKSHELKKTPARMSVLRQLSESTYAISYADLENGTRELADRVTLYRLLKSFEEKGIIHRTFDSDGAARYALCHDHCSEHQHNDQHVHFNCTACKQTVCLEKVEIPKIRLPRGYKGFQSHFSISGICKNCQHA